MNVISFPYLESISFDSILFQFTTLFFFFQKKTLILTPLYFIHSSNILSLFLLHPQHIRFITSHSLFFGLTNQCLRHYLGCIG